MAVAVAETARRRGVARTLLRELSDAARARGVRALLAGNDAVAALLEGAGGRVTAVHGETAVLEVALAPQPRRSRPPPSPLQKLRALL